MRVGNFRGGLRLGRRALDIFCEMNRLSSFGFREICVPILELAFCRSSFGGEVFRLALFAI
jgi:hypothetical protein